MSQIAPADGHGVAEGLSNRQIVPDSDGTRQQHAWKRTVTPVYLTSFGLSICLAVLGCGGAASEPQPGAGRAVIPALAATTTAAPTHAQLAAKFQAKAAAYRQIAADERAHVASSAAAVSKLELLSATSAPTGVVGPVVPTSAASVPISSIEAKNDALGAKRNNVAAWADKMAAQAQAVADFHQARVTGAVTP